MVKSRSAYYTRDTYREEYINGEDFQRRKNRHKQKYPKSYYCHRCDCRRMLDWHHIDYTKLGREDFFRDGWWMCDPLCPCSKCLKGCKKNCHFRSHAYPDGMRVPKTREALLKRRAELRKEYLLKAIRPTTLLRVYLKMAYRLFW